MPFANAVLRRLADGARALCESLPEGTPREAALRHSYPDWIAETWWRELGADEARALMAAQNEEPETAVRLVRGAIEGTGGHARSPAPGSSTASTRTRSPRGASGRRAAARSSSVTSSARGAGERTLDLCAAPGGKATMLAGEVVAVEVDEARAAQLEENARRLGAAGVRVVRADGRSLPPELDGFDRALVDAPCSGLGVLASRPDLRWRAEPLPGLQLELLRAAVARDAARRDGRLLDVHDQRGRVRGRRRRRRRGGRVEVDATPRRRVARVPAPLAPRVPADAAARPRDERLLRRPPARPLSATPRF